MVLDDERSGNDSRGAVRRCVRDGERRRVERAAWARVIREHIDTHGDTRGSGGEIVTRQRRALEARQILREYGIDIDEAANGVWLPESGDAAIEAATRAIPHKLRGSGLHGINYQRAVLDRLRQAKATGRGAQAIREALREMRDIMLRGDTFW